MTMVLATSDPTACVRIRSTCQIDVLRGIEGTIYSVGVHNGRPRFLLKFNPVQHAAIVNAWFDRYRSRPRAMEGALTDGCIVLCTPFDLNDLELVVSPDNRFQTLKELADFLVQVFDRAMGKDSDDEAEPIAA